MKRVTLKKIYDSILYNQHEVTVDPEYADKARLSIERMLEIGRK
jgi:quinolinate synthase